MDTKVTDHEFDPGDHAVVDGDHLCHDCGQSRDEHEQRQRAVFPPHVTTITALEAERDELREQLLNREAEIEGLEVARAGDDIAISELRAEVERLKQDNETLAMLQRNQAERIDYEVARVERLRAALAEISGPHYLSGGYARDIALKALHRCLNA